VRIQVFAVTLFTSLPPEIRFIIWQLSLSPRVVEILASDICTSFYSQAALPVALHVCRESRQAVEALYPCYFGSFLQPKRVWFNFDISQEEEALHPFFGVLKETELTRLKYVAIDEAYLLDGLVDLHLTIAGPKRALRAMTDLKEMIVVRDITIGRPDDFSLPRIQMKFYAERKTGEAEGSWPIDVEELPDVQEEYRDWKLSNVLRLKAGYGRRTV
jgi:hypothetical protein